MTSTDAELRSLFLTVGLDPASTSLLTETGPTAALPSVFDVTTAAATAVAASTLTASLRASQTGDSPPEPVAVDRRHAALSFRAEHFLRVGDEGVTGSAGDLLAIPPARHSLDAVQDSVVLLTVLADR